MNKSVEYIGNTMSLREPLKESLLIFDTIITKINILGEIEITQKQKALKKEYSIFEEFERTFPSICFSIATGIGKTRLMGAFVTYLVQEKGIKNFFILSPNITIYDKPIVRYFFSINKCKSKT